MSSTAIVIWSVLYIIGVLIVGTKLRKKYWRRQFELIFGFSPNEPLARTNEHIDRVFDSLRDLRVNCERWSLGSTVAAGALRSSPSSASYLLSLTAVSEADAVFQEYNRAKKAATVCNFL